MAKSKLKIIPIGGLGEIGKNMMVMEYEDDIIVIDAGLMFPEEETRECLPNSRLLIRQITVKINGRRR